MKPFRVVLWSAGLLLGFLASCSTMIQFNTQKSADPRYNGIQTVGVNTAILSQEQTLELRDDLGRWTVREKSKTDDRIETLVRKSLVSNLKKFSDYQVIDLHDLRKFQLAFQRLRPLSGERIGELDLMINVRIIYQAQQQSGNSQEVMTFRHEKSVARGKKWIKVQDSTQQKVVTIPYSHSKVDMMCYVEVIKTKNGEANVLKSFNTNLSLNSDPETTLESMINELGILISGRILKDVSKYSEITTRKIDKDSEDEVIKLMEKANLNSAATRLESILTKSKERQPADLYNLGICYEAFGDSRLALQMYREAHTRDEGNELYMKAIGELE